MNTRISLLRRWMLMALAVLCAVFPVAGARAQEVIPEVPTRYFNDYAFTVRAETADRLNRELEDFERQTSNQLRVVIYSKMQSQSEIADYCQRIARSWKVGEKDKRNGAVLFVFVQDRKINIQVGYGLEGALPDAICKDIISDRIAPKFKAGDYDGGLTAGVEGMMQAVKGEYKGTGRTQYEKQHPGGKTGGGLGLGAIFFIIFIIFIASRFFGRGGGGFIGGAGMGPILFGGGGGFGGGGSSSSGGGSSDGGGFASSGGGDFGGGGASGDW